MYTHRYFLEPISHTRHIMKSLYSRYIGFVEKVKSSAKPGMINLLNVVKYDCRSTTGSNLRKIMLKTGKNHVDDIKSKDINALPYQEILNGNEWKIGIVEEMIEHGHNLVVIPGFSRNEISDMMNYVCSS